MTGYVIGVLITFANFGEFDIDFVSYVLGALAIALGTAIAEMIRAFFELEES